MPLHDATDGSTHVFPALGTIDGYPVIPRDRMPDGSMPADAALRIVHDELMLDGNARLNLATFVTTWMEPEAEKLIAETVSKNMIDKDEYPQTAELERRCVAILAELWHGGSADESHATGCSTTGSSEASMLAGMALKWRWRARREAAGKDASKPNLVMGANVQVCWEKFCRYWEVEPRAVDCEPGTPHLTPAGALSAVDENTIGVVGVLGSTFDGSYEPIADIAAALDDLQARTGLDIPIHVDAASGGFIAPFLDPELEWDFRLPRVRSINASGHKYGLVYPGVGWVVWSSREDLPRELVFDVDYLGGSMPTFALNFSRPGSQIAAQYFTFVRYGMEGFRSIQQHSREVATHLARAVSRLDAFELLSDGSELPVFAFRVVDDAGFTVYDVSKELRSHGWLVPAYPMPPGMSDVHVLRVVVRAGFTPDLAALFLEDLERSVEALREQQPRPAAAAPMGFRH